MPDTPRRAAVPRRKVTHVFGPPSQPHSTKGGAEKKGFATPGGGPGLRTDGPQDLGAPGTPAFGTLPWPLNAGASHAQEHPHSSGFLARGPLWGNAGAAPAAPPAVETTRTVSLTPCLARPRPPLVSAGGERGWHAARDWAVAAFLIACVPEWGASPRFPGPACPPFLTHVISPALSAAGDSAGEPGSPGGVLRAPAPALRRPSVGHRLGGPQGPSLCHGQGAGHDAPPEGPGAAVRAAAGIPRPGIPMRPHACQGAPATLAAVRCP